MTNRYQDLSKTAPLFQIVVSDSDVDMEITSVYTPVVVAKPENAYLIYENGDRQCVADVVQNGTLCDESDDLDIVSVEVVSEFI